MDVPRPGAFSNTEVAACGFGWWFGGGDLHKPPPPRKGIETPGFKEK
jgi:hypothetical protein